jgi:hypothetical protein
VTFSSIPQNYRDLILVSSPIHSGSGGQQMRINGDSGSNYQFAQMIGDGSSTIANSGTLTYFTPFTNSNPATSNPVTGITQIMDYSSLDKHKTILMRNSSAVTPDSPLISAISARWANSSAVVSILIYAVSTTIAAGSTFILYGIEA